MELLKKDPWVHEGDSDSMGPGGLWNLYVQKATPGNPSDQPGMRIITLKKLTRKWKLQPYLNYHRFQINFSFTLEHDFFYF